jgi:hypothetical protein
MSLQYAERFLETNYYRCADCKFEAPLLGALLATVAKYRVDFPDVERAFERARDESAPLTCERCGGTCLHADVFQ